MATLVAVFQQPRLSAGVAFGAYGFCLSCENRLDIWTAPAGMYPFVILHGHHGYMIQALGVAERTAITKQYEEMLARLCNIKELWCLPKEKGQ